MSKFCCILWSTSFSHNCWLCALRTLPVVHICGVAIFCVKSQCWSQWERQQFGPSSERTEAV